MFRVRSQANSFAFGLQIATESYACAATRCGRRYRRSEERPSPGSSSRACRRCAGSVARRTLFRRRQTAARRPAESNDMIGLSAWLSRRSTDVCARDGVRRRGSPGSPWRPRTPTLSAEAALLGKARLEAVAAGMVPVRATRSRTDVQAFRYPGDHPLGRLPAAGRQPPAAARTRCAAALRRRSSPRCSPAGLPRAAEPELCQGRRAPEQPVAQ